MAKRFTLFRAEYPDGVATHSDLLDSRQVVISRTRARKVGAPRQDIMEDKDGPTECRLCHPGKLEGVPTIRELCGGKTGAFPNSAPYLPFDQHVQYMRHPDTATMVRSLHIHQLLQIRAAELYYNLKGAIELGQAFATMPLMTVELPRMIAGFNIGKMAGQSLPHIHSQYGWEVTLDFPDIRPSQLQIFFEELGREDLILHYEPDWFYFIAPWTPRGQYAVDLYFPKVYEIHQLTERDIKLFAWLGYRILQKYRELGIKNMNIVFSSSPLGRNIVPVVAHFVPRVNMPALYECLGRDVVDTPPATIFNQFRTMVPDWRRAITDIQAYDPEADYNAICATTPPAPEIPPTQTPPPPPPADSGDNKKSN